MPIKAVASAARLNVTRYGELLKRFAPKVIETEFEKTAYPLPDADPKEILRDLMQQNGIKADLAGTMGGRSRVSDVLTGKRSIGNRPGGSASSFKSHRRFSSDPLMFPRCRRSPDSGTRC